MASDTANESSHLRDLLAAAKQQKKADDCRIRVAEDRIRQATQYLELMKQDRTLTPTEKAIAEMALNYLRE